MKSICFFSSYYNQDKIPFYTKYYIEELCKYFQDFVFITNDKNISKQDIEYLNNLNIKLFKVNNEGFDFGMYYKAIQNYDLEEFDRFALINDSCVLFKPLTNVFEWINKSDYDFCGLVSSKRMNLHVQSYFLIINKKAINEIVNYFNKYGIINEYREVIKIYEVGLSKHLLELGFKIGALYKSFENIEQHNPSFYIIEKLIEEGIPMIKKKILFRSYRKGEYLTLLRMKFDIDEKKYINLIKKHNPNTNLIDFNRVLCDFSNKNLFGIYLYNAVLFFYKFASKSKILTWIFHKLILLRRKIKGNNNKDIIITSETKLNDL